MRRTGLLVLVLALGGCEPTGEIGQLQGGSDELADDGSSDSSEADADSSGESGEDSSEPDSGSDSWPDSGAESTSWTESDSMGEFGESESSDDGDNICSLQGTETPCAVCADLSCCEELHVCEAHMQCWCVLGCFNSPNLMSCAMQCPPGPEALALLQCQSANCAPVCG